MAEQDDDTGAEAPAARKGPGTKAIILVAVLALLLGGGGFYATFSGLVGAPAQVTEVSGPADPDAAAPAFMELDPMMISVGSSGSIRQLRFRAFLELGEADVDVAALQPRILDVFATYLRAISIDELEDPTALLHLRAQLLRRVQLLAGNGAVDDLLIIDFLIT